jgi:hypothetical protein
MPSIKCTACGEQVEVKKSQWKLLDKSSEQFCSTECLLALINTNGHPPTQMWPVEEERVGSFWSDKLGVALMSKYEESVGLFLREHEISFQYENYWFPVGTTIYIPDFYLPKTDCFLEVKGLYGIGSKAKLSHVRKQHSSLRLITVPWNARKMFA